MKINIPSENLTVTTYEYTDYINGPGVFQEINYNSGELLHTEEIETMCKEYPALNNAYKKFIDIYHICKNDFNNKQKNNND